MCYAGEKGPEGLAGYLPKYEPKIPKGPRHTKPRTKRLRTLRKISQGSKR